MQAKIIPIRKDYRDKIIKSKSMKTVMIVILILLISFFYCKDGNGQNADSIQKLQIEYNKFADSLDSHTTVKEMIDYLDNQITSKWFREGTMVELHQYFINQKYQLWLQQRHKPKK